MVKLIAAVVASLLIVGSLWYRVDAQGAIITFFKKITDYTK